MGRKGERTAFTELLSTKENHVAMDQAGKDEIDLASTPWVRADFLNVAHQVVSECRAEGVPADLRASEDSVDLLESFAALRADLTRIATVEYQQHRDVGKLAYDVVQRSHHVWKVLAYAAAARRVDGHRVGAAFPSEVTSTEEWGDLVT